MSDRCPLGYLFLICFDSIIVIHYTGGLTTSTTWGSSLVLTTKYGRVVVFVVVAAASGVAFILIFVKCLNNFNTICNLCNKDIGDEYHYLLI